MRIADYIDAMATQCPTKEALVEGEIALNYGAVRRFVHAAANALVAEPGLRRGAHAVVYSPNHHRVPLLLLAINRADMVWLSAHTRNPVEVNLQVLDFMDCDLIFFHSAYAGVVAQLKSGLPRVMRLICIDGESPLGPSLDQWMEGHWKDFDVAPEDPDATCFLQPTGGTTGPSKAAVHTHRSMEQSTLIALSAWDMRRDDRNLAVAPLTHAGGIFALQTLASGGTVVSVNLTDPGELLAVIERQRISTLFVPPTLLYAVLAHPRLSDTDLSSMRRLTLGAAPVAPDKLKLAVKYFGPVVWEGYGQTESHMPLTVKRPSDYLLPDGSFDEAALRSAGRPVVGARVEIMDADGRLLPPGERGEIVVRTSMVMREYYKNAEETRTYLRGGWCHTGDVGIKDERGFVTIVDRLKEMIVSGGFNIFPTQIEVVILGHPAVQDCAVVGVPDEKWGEAVKAVVQLRAGMSVSADELMALCRGRLGSICAPKSVEFWDSLPRSAVGKLLRREVRARYWQGQWRAI